MNAILNIPPKFLTVFSFGIRPVIPSKENEDRTARPVEFDKQAYRRRSIIEQLLGWLKECRRIFSRFAACLMRRRVCAKSQSWCSDQDSSLSGVASFTSLLR